MLVVRSDIATPSRLARRGNAHNSVHMCRIDITKEKEAKNAVALIEDIQELL